MWAMLTRPSPLFTRPTYSSISFGFVPAASTRDGDSISSGMTLLVFQEMTREELVPLLRGVLHAWAFWFALAAAILLGVLAPAGTSRLAAIVYGSGLCLLFAASATYHRWRWSPRLRPLLRRIDHSMIFVFIAASYTPVALLVLHGGLRWVVLTGVW